MDIGISEQDRARIAEGLSRLLADSYTLYLKTHFFHWNVTGPMFQTLHLMFDAQYNELALAVDQVAERIRALGHVAPGSYADYARLTSISESQGVPKAQDMIRELVQGHETVCRTARSLFPLADAASDEPTADLLDENEGQTDEDELGLRYDDIDDYLEGREIDEAAAEKLETIFLRTRHKRALPVTVHDTWWRE